MKLQLSEAQRRSVFAGLRVLADRLDQLEGWLGKGGTEGGGARWIEDVGPGERDALLIQIAEARRFLEAALERLGHPPEVVSVFQRCQAALGLGWEDSLDLKARRLRNYGPLSTAAAAEMDELGDALAEHFQRLRRTLGDPRQP